MKNFVKYCAVIELSIKTDQQQEKRDSPPDFQSVYLKIRETRICPFCGKELDGLICDCEDFKKSFKTLQEAYGDSDHESILSSNRSRNIAKYRRTMSSIEIKEIELDEDQIKVLPQISCDIPRGFQLIDYCTSIHDIFFFLIMHEERVYAYAVRNINFKGFGFGLRIRSGKSTKGKVWKTIADFESWPEFCEALVKMWFIQFKMLCFRAFFRLKYLMNKQENHQI